MTPNACISTLAHKIEDATGQNKGKTYCGELVDVDTEGESGDEVEGVTEKKCTLKAKLGFPYDDPDEAEFYGYHADMLDVTEAGDDWFVCSWYYTNGLPDWCAYENSDPNGDSAYVVNLDDEWNDWEELTEETIKVFNAAGRSFVFKVEVSISLSRFIVLCSNMFIKWHLFISSSRAD